MTRASIGSGSLARRLAKAQFRIAQFTRLMIRDPRGGLVLIGIALIEMGALHEQIAGDQRRGSHRHDKISGFQRALAWFLPLLDGGILFWFLTGVLNVDLRHPDVLVLVAAGLAVLCTVAIAAWTAALGERLQVAKNDARGLVWDAVDTVERGMLVITVVMAVLVGTMMYVRVEDEVFQATGAAGGTSTVIALTLAAAIVVLNLYVLHLAFADGSNLTRRADRLGRKIRPHVRRYERDQAREHNLREQLRHLGGEAAEEHLPITR